MSFNLPPFRVRGHHIYEFSMLARQSVGPNELATNFRDSFQRMRKTTREIQSADQESELAYIRDVIGDSPLEARKLEWKARVLYTRFVWLPSPYPFELVAAMPDEICNACVIGEHCLKRYGLKGRDLVTGDGKYLDLFEERAQKHNFAPDIVRLTREVAFSDAPPAEVPYLRTNVGIVRSMLRMYDDWDFIDEAWG